jgi:hypothetical protein
MILDTTFLHDVMHGDEEAVEKARKVEEEGTVRLSAMSVYELFYGVGYTDKSQTELRKVESVIGSKQVLPADTEVMRKAGKIDGRLSRNGEKIGQGDVVIGATALLHDERVLTRNLDEFERIPDLEVEAY